MPEAGPVLPGQEPGARRTAVGSGHVTGGEANSFLGDPVDVRGWDFLVPLTTKFSISQIVRQEDDQVGHFGNPIRVTEAGKQNERCKRDKKQEFHSERNKADFVGFSKAKKNKAFVSFIVSLVAVRFPRIYFLPNSG